jgi:hypothetical protein
MPRSRSVTVIQAILLVKNRVREPPLFDVVRPVPDGRRPQITRSVSDHLLFRPFVYQHFPLPLAGFLVGAMNAAYPTARTLLTFEKLFYGSPDPSRTGLLLFCIFNPTNKLVPCDRRQVFPVIGYFSCLS